MATKSKRDQGAQFVRYFGPLLDALRGLGGSAKTDEAVDGVAEGMNIAETRREETRAAGGSRVSNQVDGARV